MELKRSDYSCQEYLLCRGREVGRRPSQPKSKKRLAAPAGEVGRRPSQPNSKTSGGPGWSPGALALRDAALCVCVCVCVCVIDWRGIFVRIQEMGEKEWVLVARPSVVVVAWGEGCSQMGPIGPHGVAKTALLRTILMVMETLTHTHTRTFIIYPKRKDVI